MSTATSRITMLGRECRCLACGAEGYKAVRLLVQGPPEYALCECPKCGACVFDPPPAPDYTSHTASQASIAHYVEIGVSPESLVENVAGIVAACSHGRLLDVGCGFGFLVDIVGTVPGWTAQGVEPSTYGQRGQELLGVEISPLMLADAVAEGKVQGSFDVIHASEVIEHIFDPMAFIGELRGHLTPDGVLVLTTPNADALYGTLSTSLALALLSPGYHCMLLTPMSLEHLLRSAGFAHVTVRRRGASLVACAGSAPLDVNWEAGDREGMVERYYRAKLACPGLDPMVAGGLRYRLYRRLVNQGRYAQADEIFAQFGPMDLAARERIATLDDWTRVAPFYVGPLYYYRGMQLLNGAAAYSAAADAFGVSVAWCEHHMRVSPSTGVEESELIWPALFHQALALHYGGENRAASAVIQEFLRRAYEAESSDASGVQFLIGAGRALAEQVDEALAAQA